MTRLSGSVVVHEDEHAMSVVARLAAAQGLRLGDFCRHLGVDLRGVAAGRTGAIRELAYLAGVNFSALRDRSVISHDGFYTLGGERLLVSNLMRRPHRFCPHCLNDDRANGDGSLSSRPYGRVSWLVSFVCTCDVHNVGLLTVDSPDLGRISSEFSASEFDVGVDPDQAPSRAPTAFESYIASRLRGRPETERTFLDSLPLHVAGSLCELIGAADVFCRLRLPYNRTDEEWIARRQFGFGLLHRPGEPLKELLREFASEIRSKSASGAVKTAYNHVYRTLKNSLKHSDFDCLRVTFREASIEELPLAPGDNVFGPIEHRRWHTIASASREFDINMSALGEMLEYVGIISKYDYRVSPHDTLIPEAVMTNFARRLSSSLDKAQMGRLLGVKAPILDKFLDLKLLAPSGLRRSFNDRTPLFDPEGAESLIQRLRGDAAVSHGPKKFLDILKIRSVAGCTLAEIVDLLVRRRLTRVYFDEARTGIAAIRIDPAEVREIMAGRPLNVIDPPFGLPKLRSLSSSTIWRLVDDGHLTYVVIPHHIYGTPHSVVTAWSVELFEERYATLAELAARFFTDARSLRRELEEKEVAPFLNDPHPEKTLYDLTEVAGLKIGKRLL